MRIKTITAPDLQQAMNIIRDSLGDEAVILSTTREQKGISVTVAIDEPTPPATKLETRAAHPAMLAELEEILQFHNVPELLMRSLLESAQHLPLTAPNTAEDISRALAELINHSFTFNPIRFGKEAVRIMLIGAPGIGKTMTIAKLAAEMTMNKRKVGVITTDKKRAGGVEQLAAFTDILNIKLQVAGSRAELKSAISQFDPETTVLIDSAGANPYDFEEMKDLGQFASLNGIEPVLATAAGGDCAEAEESTRAFLFLGVKRLMITKADITRRMGAVLTAAICGNLSFSNISDSPKVVASCSPLTPELLATLMLRHTREVH